MLDRRIANLEGNDIPLYWVTSDRDCFNYVVHDWNEYAHQIMSLVPQKTFVVQAGGNCGLYPLMYSKYFERVFTFEPDPVNFHCLAVNCISNKIIKINSAVGEKQEFLKIGIVDKLNVGMHRVGAGDVIVYSLPIDCLNLQHLALLHLDIEGFEYQAILGAIDTIKRCRPVVVLEVTALELELITIMKKLNYIEAMRFGEPLNIAFVPKERT